MYIETFPSQQQITSCLKANCILATSSTDSGKTIEFNGT